MCDRPHPWNVVVHCSSFLICPQPTIKGFDTRAPIPSVNPLAGQWACERANALCSASTQMRSAVEAQPGGRPKVQGGTPASCARTQCGKKISILLRRLDGLAPGADEFGDRLLADRERDADRHRGGPRSSSRHGRQCGTAGSFFAGIAQVLRVDSWCPASASIRLPTSRRVMVAEYAKTREGDREARAGRMMAVMVDSAHTSW